MTRVEVRLTQGPGDERVVGQLVENGPRVAERRIYFEYDPEFLQDPIWLSPFKLPPRPGLIEHRDRDFGPLFGLFDDSLPDGWGLLLMDRFFTRAGWDLERVSVLDRLTYLGTRTLGALTYHPPSQPESESPRNLDLQELAEASREVVAGRSTEVLPQLLRSGGSPGGARPKVLVGVAEGGDSLLAGEENLPAGYSYWIVKFRGPEDPADSGAVEQTYAEMAREVGISMPSTRLFETEDGDRYFGVERFDRRGDRRFHVHTLGNLIHSNFRIPSCDYRQYLEVTRVLTRNHADVLEAFRRMVFNVATHNRDDHVKNFAFRWTQDGGWRLAPAYDLVFSQGPGGEHSMTADGEGKTPGRRHLLAVAQAVGLTARETQPVLERILEVTRGWSERAEESGVGPESRKRIQATLRDCAARLRG